MIISFFQSCTWWDSNTNGYFSTPDTQPGVNRTAFILYVAALSSSRCQFHRTVAFAAHCQQEKALDRSAGNIVEGDISFKIRQLANC